MIEYNYFKKQIIVMISEVKTVLINGNESLSVKEPTDEEFECFRKIVLKELGLSWNEDKKYLLYARLQRRLHFLKFRTFREYHEYLQIKDNDQ